MNEPGPNHISRENIFQEIKVILEPWVKPARFLSVYSPKAHIIRDLGLDSVVILHLIMGVEESFGITVENYELDMEVLSELDNLVNLIESKINETP